MAKRKFDNHNAMVNYEPPAQHPIGLAMGAAVGGAAGAAAGAAMAGAAESAVAGAATGSAAGPVGTVAGAVVGAVAGAVAGGVVGKEVAEAINPSEPDRHWRQNYHTRPYVKEGDSYEVYEAAYLYGIEAYSEYRGRHFND
ncbi:MAG: hypothetical protein JO089_09100, partial [Alphaproteobacteria bacterium]|nr:hypothetical protein [Alphaproteobacteria bacterium]